MAGLRLDQRPMILEHDTDSLRLCIAQAVWSAYINAEPMRAARVALDGKSAVCVRKWFNRNSKLMLASELRKSVLEHMLVDNTSTPYAGVLQMLLAMEGPSTPHEIYDVLTMDTTMSSVLALARNSMPDRPMIKSAAPSIFSVNSPTRQRAAREGIPLPSPKNLFGKPCPLCMLNPTEFVRARRRAAPVSYTHLTLPTKRQM
eukprot:TRINITY_DN22471_c0_g1_i1.p1 TRINITY_DN22471_c0_g1~~TRINITY_DN22471_c0_g1_i1.p1  ORF type:complete len:202 (+),score=26.31 TRINITY_DN22471_c0_g1_i1:29-634(+)